MDAASKWQALSSIRSSQDSMIFHKAITTPFLCTFSDYCSRLWIVFSSIHQIQLLAIPLYMSLLQIVTMSTPAWSISYMYSKEAARFTKVLSEISDAV
ncbi:hypothetical protein EV424DRAFT_1409566, partial [Suillus variegatus]